MTSLFYSGFSMDDMKTLYLAMTLLLTVVGVLGTLYYSLRVVLLAFKRNLLWGVSTVFIPFVFFVYVFLHWEESRYFFVNILKSVGACVIAWVALLFYS